MSAKVISKVLEVENCKKEPLLEAILKPRFWEEISPVTRITAKKTAPNVIHTSLVDEIAVIKIPIEMEGELVFMDKGEDPGKGHLLEFNVRNNKDVRELEGNFRVKQLSNNKAKLGIFIKKFILESDFLNLIGKSTSELVLRTKISDLLRNLERYCKSNNLEALLEE